MADREDIDALLIGRLYGELSSADEARLQTHLEAHPGDRTALDDLTHARGLVRSSRLLDAQVEPPQQLSALLMQEAARRAPKAAPSESWFQRFMRSFIAHPAMAAAATLVLVVGIAGTMYLKKGNHFATETTTSSAAARQAEALGVSTTADPEAQAPASAVAVATPAAAGSAAAGELTLGQGQAAAPDTSGGMVVGLADGEGRGDVAKAKQQGQAPRGIEVDVPGSQRQPKDFDDNTVLALTPPEKVATKPMDAKPVKPSASPRKAMDPYAYGGDATGDPQVATGSTGGAGAGPSGGATAKGGAKAPAQHGSVTLDESDARDRGYASETEKTTVAKDKVATAGKPPAPAYKPTPQPVTSTTSPATSPAPPPPPVAPVATSTKKEDSNAAPVSTVNERELAAAVSAAHANKCDVADTYATRIANRDVDYYSTNVETNRELKNCRAVMKQAPRAAETQRAKRSQKRATTDSK